MTTAAATRCCGGALEEERLRTDADTDVCPAVQRVQLRHRSEPSEQMPLLLLFLLVMYTLVASCGCQEEHAAAAFAPMSAHRTTPTHLVLVNLASIAVARRSDAIQRPVESRADHNGAGTFAPSRTPLASRPGDGDRCRPESKCWSTGDHRACGC